ncbi:MULTISPECIES: hypothetical protein [Burkholderia]|uniref:hypothetical protein n=1 Tax=Burkholderia TaxID=32008 RepID=UPI000863C244|nr:MULTISPECIES: hypothetical protein [Burkholderia]AOL05356.1 hypothetical protein WI95_16355 [Burkholderia contaminans]TCW63408.1 hypothetical protein C5O79_34950 [Burkholderia sp. SRS-25]
MANINLRTRVERLEQRQPESYAVDTIVITGLEDMENTPRLIWRLGQSGFEEVPEGTTWEDLRR